MPLPLVPILKLLLPVVVREVIAKAVKPREKPTMFKSLVERFKEPSSWAGIAVLWAVFGGRLGIPFELVQEVGVALASLLAFILAEKPKE
jgi:hypothetical protein